MRTGLILHFARQCVQQVRHRFRQRSLALFLSLGKKAVVNHHQPCNIPQNSRKIVPAQWRAWISLPRCRFSPFPGPSLPTGPLPWIVKLSRRWPCLPNNRGFSFSNKWFGRQKEFKLHTDAMREKRINKWRIFYRVFYTCEMQMQMQQEISSVGGMTIFRKS